MKIFLALFFTLSLLLCAQEKSLVEYNFTSETDLLYKTPIISEHFYKKKLEYFHRDKIEIAYKIFEVEDAKANIVFLSGRTEGMIKYQELIYDLNQNGYSVYILDHRGQGYSSRLLADTQIGYVESFFDYVLDLKVFVDTKVSKDKKLILLAHSMGGTVASLYVEKFTNDFDALVLTSPMHQPKLINDFLSDSACSLISLFPANPKTYVYGAKSYDASPHNFDKNIYTHSRKRYEISHLVYMKEPQTKVGGASFGWVSEACAWSKKSVTMAKNIKIPVLIFQAGEDKIVNAQAQEKFCKSIAKCDLEKIDGAFHEVLVEKDSMRENVLRKMLDFISKI